MLQVQTRICNERGRRLRVGLLAFMTACLCFSMVANLFVLPVQAYAMDTIRWTAKANNDNKDLVMGGQPTRVTWQGQPAEGEEVTKIDLVLPEGVEYEVDDVTTTVLEGTAHVDAQPDVSKAEDNALNVSFAEAIDADKVIMIEVNRAVFPAEGGSFQVQGTYTLADGSVEDIPEFVRPIEVTLVSPSEEMANWLSEQGWVQAINDNSFLHAFLDPTVIVTSVPIVFQGFAMALAVVAVAFPLAIPIGLALSLMRMSKFRILRFLGSLYVNIVRGTPLFLQIYIAFLGLPYANIVVPQFPLAVAVLGMNSAAYLCEIFRAGIQSISKGQFEAARSLGMTGAQTMLFVIIPQTVRRVLPTMTSEFILLYKDTSLLASVGMMEVVLYAKTTVATTGSLAPYIVAACFYLIITVPMAKLVGTLEARLGGASNGGGKSRKRKKKVAGAPVGVADETLEETLGTYEAEELSTSPERFSSM